MSSIGIRLAEERDCDDIFRWRNDSVTIRNSPTGEVKYEDHVNWYMRKIKDPFTTIYVINHEKTKIGMLRFDIKEDKTAAEVSINMAPESRGKGLGYAALSKGIRQYLCDYDVNTIEAQIMKHNQVSIGLFEKVGFHKKSEEDSILRYVLYREQLE